MKHTTPFWPLAFLATLGACDWTDPSESAEEAQQRRERVLAEQLKAACASDATYDRLKQVVFDEAIQVRNADPVNLDLLSSYSLARVENPVVKSRDETLDVTVCSGRFILQVPPGAERAFDGKQRLVADIEYAAQAAADGSGLVYQISGAEPIIYSLATFDLRAQAFRPAPAEREARDLAQADPAPPPPPERQSRTSSAAPEGQSRPHSSVPERQARAARPTSTPTPTTREEPARQQRSVVSPPPPPRQTERAADFSPSFDCQLGRSRSEQMVCNSERLAAIDREMSAQFYSELSRSDQRVRAELRRSRDRFLAYREQCPDESCLEQAYLDRMDEIEDIAAGY